MAKKYSKRGIAVKNSVSKKKTASKKRMPVKKRKLNSSKGSAFLKKPSKKFVITTKDISDVLSMNIRTAQRLLKGTRDALDKEKGDYVTVKEFCEVHKFSEDVFRTQMV